MHEWVMVLKMMTTDRHQWMTPPAPAPILMKQQKRELSEAERRELRRAVWKIAREATGELRHDEASGFYVPVRTER